MSETDSETPQHTPEVTETQKSLKEKTADFYRKVLSKDNEKAIMVGAVGGLFGVSFLGGPIGWAIGAGLGLAAGHRMDIGARKFEEEMREDKLQESKQDKINNPK